MSRLYAKISEAELKRKIIEAIKANLDPLLDEDALEDVEEDWPYHISQLGGKIAGDLSKIEFDYENVNISPAETRNRLVGFHNINGFTFCGVEAGGDWENSVFFIIYWDGRRLRGYIPNIGNTFNTDTKKAFGNDHKADAKWFKDNCSDELAAEYTLYLNPNSDKLLEDIQHRLKEKT